MYRRILTASSFLLILLALTGAHAARAKTKHYEKDGLSFDYPDNWVIQERSDDKKQLINLSISTSFLQINVYAHREPVDSPEKVEDAKTRLVNGFITQLTNEMKQQGMNPARTDGTSTIGTTAGDVAHVKEAGADGGGADVHYAVVNNRMVMFSAFGPDTDLQKYGAQLDAIRASIAIAPTLGLTPVPTGTPAKP
jgi:hypothetical protein